MKASLLHQALKAVTGEGFRREAAKRLQELERQASGDEKARIGQLWEVLESHASDEDRQWMRTLGNQAAALDSLELRIERLDARRKSDPGQMDLFGGGGGPGTGKPCGESHIAAPLECHKGGGGGLAVATTPATTAAPSITLAADGAPLFNGKPAKKKLGEGCFGTTYLIDLPDGGQGVAKLDKIKNRSPFATNPNPSSGEKVEERLQMVQREIDMQRAAHRLGIAAEVLGDVQKLSDGRYGFIYRFEPGEPLMNRPVETMQYERNPKADEILRNDRNRANTYESIARFSRLVAEGGIDHNDLNPSNVLISPDGTVKIIDWALAERTTNPDPLKLAEIESWALGTLSQNSGVLGTFRKGNGKIKMGVDGFVNDDVRDRISRARRARTDFYEPRLIEFESGLSESQRAAASKEMRRLRDQEGMGIREAGIKVGLYPPIDDAYRAQEAAAVARHWSADHLRRMRRSIDKHVSEQVALLRE